MQPAAPPPAVEVRVRPDTVTIGQPFMLELRATAAPGELVRFPAEPDSGTAVALRDPAELPSAATAGADGRLVWRARYALAAWQVGALAIPLGPVTIGARTAPVFATVVVASVLPADTAQRTPRPPRPPVPLPAPWWRAWLLGALAAALLGWLAARVARARRRPRPAPRAIDRLREGLARLEVERCLAAGETVHAVGGAAALFRRFLRERWREVRELDELPPLEPGDTTRELARRLDAVAWPRAAEAITLLETIDAVRFAPAPLDVARARACIAPLAPLAEAMETALAAREAARTAPARRAA
jgi:hypothetical protein